MTGSKCLKVGWLFLDWIITHWWLVDHAVNTWALKMLLARYQCMAQQNAEKLAVWLQVLSYICNRLLSIIDNWKNQNLDHSVILKSQKKIKGAATIIGANASLSHTSCRASECQNSFFSIIRTPGGWGNGAIQVVHVTDNNCLYLLHMISKSAIAFRVNTPFLKYKNRKHFDVEEQFGFFHIPK